MGLRITLSMNIIRRERFLYGDDWGIVLDI